MTSSDQTGPRLCCPRCRGDVARREGAYHCGVCGAGYPVVAGIADFRLWPDPYIGIEADRRKAEHLAEACRTRTFAGMLDYYYSITPEDPPDLARHWSVRALAEPEIAARLLSEAELTLDGPLLDLGCSTGGLLIAAADREPRRAVRLTGVDVALRWLAIGAARLREAGVAATLVCANAEALPFPESQFSTLTATDLLEHLRDAPAALAEAVRVLAPEGRTMWTTNNRFSLLAEPHVKLWGVGWLPRRWQAPYVAWRRKDLHRYRIALKGAREVRRLFAAAGFASVEVAAAPVSAPHRAGDQTIAIYEGLREAALSAALLERWGPKLWIRAGRP